MVKASLSIMEWTRDDIVEYILLLCAPEATFDDLMQLMTASSSAVLKKYLFFLIDYDLILYNGQKRVYVIKDKGFQVLSRIIESKIL
jgi:predicted transcriptional regulator